MLSLLLRRGAILPALLFYQVVAAFHHITELEAHGINRNDVQRLSEAGYCTVESVSYFMIEVASGMRSVHACCFRCPYSPK